MNPPSSSTSVAVVTGGSAGIGAAICRLLLARGLHVINLDRNPPAEASSTAQFIEVDLSDSSATAQVAAGLAKAHSVTRIVNNAGVNIPNLVQDVPLEHIDLMASLHLKTPLILTQAFLPAMQAARFGRIVNIASRAVLGNTHRSAYASTKAGMIGLTRTWALELGQYGITVNTVAPGMIDTALMARTVPVDSPMRKTMTERIAVKRIGTPDELAHAVGFFLDEGSSYVTGQTLYVCGGASLGGAPL
ncbi:MAG: SDR family NAD(P)-dependent oxidoreductase [Burkholderiaceae bacterium]|nr:SDR family NAD(P)-dependent oxidoreductase [Burkholderiaceae bacterium]